MNFAALCTFIVVATLTMSYLLIPILWDTAGAIQDILEAMPTLGG